jgi:hypothetical protein
MPFLSSVEGVFGYGRPQPPPNAVVEFNYPNFSSTAGLVEVSTAGVIGNALYLTTAVNADTGNVYRSTAIQYNRNFSFEWNFECSGGSVPPGDGFCLQWTTTNNTNGGGGGAVGYVTTAAQAFTFLTFTNNLFRWYTNNVEQTTQTGQNFYQNLFYWADYNHATSTMRIYFSTISTKPASVNFTLTGFSFDATPYYIGFGAATGGANENHILRSMKLTFT